MVDESELGFGGGYDSYRKLTIDNGTNTQGDGATGAYVIKGFKDGQVTRTMFSKEFEGVILLSRTMFKEKGAKATWRTNEFNSLNPDAKIAILSLFEGKPIKDAAGNYKVAFATKAEIEARMSFTTPKGAEHSYDHYVVLYVRIEATGEIVKIVFKGTGRGSFFEYMKTLRNAGKTPYSVVTKFSTVLDKYSKYALSVRVAVDENGKMKVPQAPEEIESAQSRLVDSGKQIFALYAGAQSTLPTGQPAQAKIEDVNANISANNDTISEDEVPFES